LLPEPGKGPARTHRDVRELALVAPRLAAVDLDDARARVAVLGRDAVDPQVRGLDHVVVGRHQLHVGGQHRGPPCNSGWVSVRAREPSRGAVSRLTKKPTIGRWLP